MRLTHKAALFGAWLFLPAAARGQAGELPGAQLFVERTEPALDCPDGAALTSRVRELIHAARLDEAAPTRIDVKFDHASGRHSAELVVSGARGGTRRLSATEPGCRALGEAVAVAIALILDQERTREPTTSPGAEDASAATEASPPPAATPEANAPRRPAPARRESRRNESRAGRSRHAGSPVQIDALAGAALTLGVTRDVSGAAFAGADARRGVARGALVAFITLDQSEALGRGDVSVQLAGGQARACFMALSSSGAGTRLYGCLVGAVGLLSVESEGYFESKVVRRPWLAAGAAAELVLPLTADVGLGSGAALLAPLHEERFSIENLGLAYETPPLGGWLELSAHLKLP